VADGVGVGTVGVGVIVGVAVADGVGVGTVGVGAIVGVAVADGVGVGTVGVGVTDGDVGKASSTRTHPLLTNVSTIARIME